MRLLGAFFVAMAVVSLVGFTRAGPRLKRAAGSARRNIIGNRKRESSMSASLAGLVGVGLIAARPTSATFVAAGVMAAGGWQIPLIRARTKENTRQRTFDLELSDALGEMVMGVEAGLTLEAVMNLYARAHDTSLAKEFSRALDLIQLGSTRATALEEFRTRTPTPLVSMFVAAVQQNQRLGTPLAAVLRQQGRTARRRRQQAVEEYAAKLSLKMVFPTVFCVLPVLLIVIVGPAVIRIIDSWPK